MYGRVGARARSNARTGNGNQVGTSPPNARRGWASREPGAEMLGRFGNFCRSRGSQLQGRVLVARVSMPTTPDHRDVPPSSSSEADVLAGKEAALDLNDIDLDDLDDDLDSAGRVRRGRSVWVSLLVILVGGVLLVHMYGDFRFWLASDDDVVELGHVSELVRNGRLQGDHSHQRVAIQGTPDVQSAARFTTKDGYVGFLRLIESGTAVFAAIPRESERAPDQFPTRFVGRLRRLDDTPARDWVRRFFAAEAITESFEVDPKALIRSVGAADAGAAGSDSEDPRELYVEASDSTVRRLASIDRVQVTLAQEQAVVQMGRGSWRSRAAAREKIASLGRAFGDLEVEHSLYFSFVIAADRNEYAELEDLLNAGLDIPANNPQPNLGAMLVSRRSSHVTRVETLAVDERGRLQYEVQSDSVGLGWYPSGDQLVEKRSEGSVIRLAPDAIGRIQIDRHLAVGTHTHVLSVGELPSSKRLMALLFLLVLGLVLSNTWTVVRVLRLRARGPISRSP